LRELSAGKSRRTIRLLEKGRCLHQVIRARIVLIRDAGES
jgi:hypothetical protein